MENNVVTQQHPIEKLLNDKTTKNSLKNLLGNSKIQESFSATLLNIAMDKNLATCSAESILDSALKIAQLKLPITKQLGQAYIVRYKKDAEPIIGYKGWLALLERAGKICRVSVVFNCDEFEFSTDGFYNHLKLVQNYEKRRDEDDEWAKQNLKGVVVAIKDQGNGEIFKQFVTAQKIFKIMGMSPSKDSPYSPYKNWAVEMFQAKAIKYVLSRTAINEEIALAVKVDNSIDIQEVTSSIENNIPKQTFEELKSSVEVFGLQLRLQEDKAIVIGNVWQKENMLKGLGFYRSESNQWVAKVSVETDPITHAIEHPIMNNSISQEVTIPSIKNQADLKNFLESLGFEIEESVAKDTGDIWIKITGNSEGLLEVLTQLGFYKSKKGNLVMNISHIPSQCNQEENDKEAEILF